MTMKKIGILLDPSDGDLLLNGGALAVGNTLYQNQFLILKAQKGDLKEFPMMGAGIEPPRFDPNRILLNELIITGAFNYDHDGFEQALALLASEQLPVDVLLEPVVASLDDLLPTMRALADGRLAGKVLVQP